MGLIQADPECLRLVASRDVEMRHRHAPPAPINSATLPKGRQAGWSSRAAADRRYTSRPVAKHPKPVAADTRHERRAKEIALTDQPSDRLVTQNRSGPPMTSNGMVDRPATRTKVWRLELGRSRCRPSRLKKKAVHLRPNTPPAPTCNPTSRHGGRNDVPSSVRRSASPNPSLIRAPGGAQVPDARQVTRS